MRHPDEGTGQRPGRRPDEGHLDEGTIHAWLDGALDATESARVEQHAASCEACSAMVAEARGLVAAASRILTRLDDVPARVMPAGTSAASMATAPTPASVGPRLARRESAVRRRPRWSPTVWTISAAAAAVLMAVLVTGDEAERLLDQAMPASATATDSAPLASERAAEQVSVQATEQTNAPAAGAKAEAETESPDAASTAPTAPAATAAPAPVPAPAPATAQERGARMARTATEDVPGPPAVADEDAQRSERRTGGFVPRASDAPAPAQAAAPVQLRGRVGSALGAASALSRDSSLLRYDGRDTAADFQLAEVPVWSDSLTRTRLPLRLGFGRRILAGARLVESTMVTTNELERRSVYELEDGARVTLIEGPTTSHLEAVVTTGAGAAPPPAAQSAPQANARAAPAPALRQEAAKTVAPADSAAMLEPVGTESVVVRPDGTIRLEWRDGGAALALEGPLSIDRLRALRDRVRH